MSNDFQLSNSIPIIIFLVKEMVINDGFTNLDILLKNSLRYQHHCKNYEKNIALDLIPKASKLRNAMLLNQFRRILISSGITYCGMLKEI